MELLDFIFRLGVVFAIYGFLWGLIEIAFKILTAQRQRTLIEIYLLRTIKYVFLADVTFLFCIDGNSANMIVKNQLIFAALILLTYFVGKLQNNQNKIKMFQVMGNLRQQASLFNMRFEIGSIVISLGAFAFFVAYQQYAVNPVSHWFHDSIINIEDTPIFGFIFKIIGFFFLLSMLTKMFSGIMFILNGGKSPKPPGDGNPYVQDDNQNQSNGFDDYEELN